MKKYLHIPIAIALILVGIWGCTLNRPRPLLTCFPTDDWTTAHMVPDEGTDGTLAIAPEALKEAMDVIDVRPRSHFSGWSCETIFLHIQAESTAFSVEIGENGDISIAELSNPDGSATYWSAEDAVLYEALQDFCQP